MPSSSSKKGSSSGGGGAVLYPGTRSALSAFVSHHACAMCGKEPIEADELPLQDWNRLPHLFACCNGRACGKCVGNKDLKEMGSRCPVCAGPLLNVDVDHTLLFHMETVRRLKKALWEEGPGKGDDKGDNAHLAISLSPSYESQNTDTEAKSSGGSKRKVETPKRKTEEPSSDKKRSSKKKKEEKKPLSSSEDEDEDKLDIDSIKEEIKTPRTPKTPRGGAKPKVEKVKPEKVKLEKVKPEKVKVEKVVDKAANDSAAFLAKTNNKGETKLHQACIKGNYNQVVNYLQDGADPNTKCNNGWTPLHEAAQKGSTEIARVLLEAGAVPNVYSFEYTTPLHEAVVSVQPAIVTLLLRHGADPDFKDHEGNSPKSLATATGNKNLLRLLEDPDSQFMSTQERDESHLNSFVAAREFLKKAGKQKLIVYLSNASPNDVKWARSVLGPLDGRLEQKELTNDVSHVAVMPPKAKKGGEESNADKEKRKKMAADNDVGYLRALAKGVTVVTADWLKTSEEEGTLADEEDFFVTGTPGNPKSKGPERSRMNSLMLKPKLFHGCQFFFKGKFEGGLSQNDLQLIVTSGGGKILTREPNSESIDARKRSFHGMLHTLSICTHYIIYQDDENAPNNLIKYNMPHLKALPMMWLVHSVLEHQLLDPAPFRE